MSEPLSPRAAQIRLAQYDERTKTWSTATYDSGTEKALREIAQALSAEVDRQRGEVRDLAARLNELESMLCDCDPARALDDVERPALYHHDAHCSVSGVAS